MSRGTIPPESIVSATDGLRGRTVDRREGDARRAWDRTRRRRMRTRSGDSSRERRCSRVSFLENVELPLLGIRTDRDEADRRAALLSSRPDLRRTRPGGADGPAAPRSLALTSLRPPGLYQSPPMPRCTAASDSIVPATLAGAVIRTRHSRGKRARLGDAECSMSWRKDASWTRGITIPSPTVTIPWCVGSSVDGGRNEAR